MSQQLFGGSLPLNAFNGCWFRYTQPESALTYWYLAMDDKKTEGGKQEARDLILDLNFVPQWARKAPSENHYANDSFPDRAPRGERRERRSRPDGNRNHARRGPRQDRQDRPRPHREPLRELPLKITFLPEQKRLASLVRQIHHSRRAYPLMDLANLLMQDKEGYMVKLTVEPGAADFHLYQCKCCKAITESAERMEQHIQKVHLEDLFDKEEIETEPPAGQFVCVARCRLSGTLLGPPNHHSYTAKVNEVHRSKYAHLSIDEYKRNIETVPDEELIEQWKRECCKQTVFKRKDNPEAKPIDRVKAELQLSKQLPEMYEPTERAVVPSAIARKLEDPHVMHAIRRAYQKESHFPLSMSFAMRAAFRHMHLYLFKAGKINFVTHIKPKAIRPEDTIESIGEVLRFLQEHPGSTREQLAEGLRPESAPDAAAEEFLKPLTWLIERGHIIEFFNGTLSVPLGALIKKQ